MESMRTHKKKNVGTLFFIYFSDSLVCIFSQKLKYN